MVEAVWDDTRGTIKRVTRVIDAAGNYYQRDDFYDTLESEWVYMDHTGELVTTFMARRTGHPLPFNDRATFVLPTGVELVEDQTEPQPQPPPAEAGEMSQPELLASGPQYSSVDTGEEEQADTSTQSQPSLAGARATNQKWREVMPTLLENVKSGWTGTKQWVAGKLPTRRQLKWGAAFLIVGVVSNVGYHYWPTSGSSDTGAKTTGEKSQQDSRTGSAAPDPDTKLTQTASAPTPAAIVPEPPKKQTETVSAPAPTLAQKDAQATVHIDSSSQTILDEMKAGFAEQKRALVPINGKLSELVDGQARQGRLLDDQGKAIAALSTKTDGIDARVTALEGSRTTALKAASTTLSPPATVAQADGGSTTEGVKKLAGRIKREAEVRERRHTVRRTILNPGVTAPAGLEPRLYPHSDVPLLGETWRPTPTRQQELDVIRSVYGFQR